MSKLQPPNYTQTPNIILDHMDRLSDAELRVVLFICRQTFGWQRERTKRCSQSFIAKATGMSGQGVFNATKRLLTTGLLCREALGDSFRYWLNVEGIEADPLNGVENPPSTAFIAPLNGVETHPLNGVETKKESSLKKEGNKEGADAPPPAGQPTGKPVEPPVEEEAKLPPEAVFWNSNCGALPKVLSCSGSRLDSLRARRKDKFWVDNFKGAVLLASKSKFCLGDNDRGWRADFSFIVKRESVVKIMEGKYANKPNGSNKAFKPTRGNL